MKRISLFLTLLLVGTLGFSQVIFQVRAPSTPANLQGTYPITWADPGSGGWSTPDLNNPANAITGELVFVDDGTAGTHALYGFPLSRDACSDFTQPSLVGKIAVIYRADCEFGYKAAVAENAGAIGVVIINHTGAPVGMAGGDSGLFVTIPLVMISEQDGALLESAITNGTLTDVFIGSKAGIFAHDVAILPAGVMRARRFANLAALSRDASEFSVPVGGFAMNFGNTAQTNVKLKATISHNGSVIYSDSSTIANLPADDTTWISLSTFSQTSYPTGLYSMQYTIKSDSVDGDQNDNTIDTDFMISDSLYSYGRLETDGTPISPAGFQSANFGTNWEGCLAFDDPNASRVRALGMSFSATTTSTADLINKFVEIRAYQWDDAFGDITQGGFGFNSVTQLNSTFYIYTADLQDSVIYLPFSSQINLADNQRYMFCINSSNQDVFIGYDNRLDYTTIQNDGVLGINGAHLQPSTPGASDNQYFLNGFGLDVQVAASVKMEVLSTGIDEISAGLNIVPFPNPTIGELNIPVGDVIGTATIEIYDIAGKLAIVEPVRFSNHDVLKLDLSHLDNGSYIGKMTFKDGSTSKFNVIVNR